MKVVADGVQEAGGRLVGVSVDFLPPRPAAAPTRWSSPGDLAERKALLLAQADAVVVMVGGTGTLDEATEILELKKHGLHDKPVVLLNTAGFYDGLEQQFRRMDAEGFLPAPARPTWSSSPRTAPGPWPTWRRAGTGDLRHGRTRRRTVRQPHGGHGYTSDHRRRFRHRRGRRPPAARTRGDDSWLLARDAGRAKELAARFPGARDPGRRPGGPRAAVLGARPPGAARTGWTPCCTSRASSTSARSAS